MVQIDEDNNYSVNADIPNPLTVQRKKKVRLATFTSSASLILSWPFPLIILCFQSNQCIVFDPRVYAALIMAYLFSGSMKRLLLERFMSPTFCNAMIPSVLGLLGNGVFLTALYRGGNWGGLAVSFMVGSRLCFGWSTYSAEDYNRRAKNVAKSSRDSERTKERVMDMVPDLQDTAFHAGVIVALVICFILEACLRFVGPQMAEFYSVLILTGFSTFLSMVSVPSLHSAVRTLVNMPAEDEQEPRPTASASNARTVSSSDGNYGTQQQERTPVGGQLVSHVLSLRDKYLVGTLFKSLRLNPHPPGQLVMIIFSALLTTGTILFDYLLLPYFVVYLRRNLFSPADSFDFFPFPDFTFVYASLFASELIIRTLVLEYTDFSSVAKTHWATSTLVGALAGVAGLSITMPALLYGIGTGTAGVPHGVFGLCLFLVCLLEGGIKAGHALLGGVLFTKYCDSDLFVIKSVAETGEQLLGVARCFFAALLFIIGGAILYHQHFLTTMVMVSWAQCLALSVAMFGFAQVYLDEKSLLVRIEEP